MIPNYLNPNYLLSRLLEKTGIAKTYLEKVELAAHLFAGATFSLASTIWSPWIVVAWSVFVLIDEFVFDGWKGRDTLIDLVSKLVCPAMYLLWIVACRSFVCV